MAKFVKVETIKGEEIHIDRDSISAIQQSNERDDLCTVRLHGLDSLIRVKESAIDLVGRVEAAK